MVVHAVLVNILTLNMKRLIMLMVTVVMMIVIIW